MNVNWTPRGLERLNGIVREIAFGDGISTALKWHDDIFDATEQLTDFPLSGRIVPEIGRREIRELILAPYRIIYRTNADSCDVLSVRHGRRKITSMRSL